MNKLNNKKGISLLVLVITIIVMIILAAAIILSLQSSGIIGKANEAKAKTDVANAKQIVAIAQAEWELMDTSEKSNYSDGFSEYAEEKLNSSGYNTGTGTGNYEVSSDGTVYSYPKIPKGFVASEISTEDEVSEGLVIYELNEGEKNISDWETTPTGKTYPKVQSERNQYVWVPVTDINQFVRKDGYFNGNLQTYVSRNIYVEPYYTDEYREQLVAYNKMKASVEKYGGFYIARYESGLPEGKTTSNVTSNDSPVTRKEANVWNREAWGRSPSEPGTTGVVFISQNIYPESENFDVVSTLCYGVQWDATMEFMKDVSNPNAPGKKYIENSIKMGWHIDNYEVGNPEYKTGIDVDSEKSNMVKNIYDMAGNVFEWTMETDGDTDAVVRGGFFDDDGDKKPASYRNNSYTTWYNGDVRFGFRVALYLK